MDESKYKVYFLVLIIVLLSYLFLYCTKNAQEPEKENIIKGSGILIDTLRCSNGVWETFDLPKTTNYFEFKITWAYIFEFSKEKNWRLIFKPESGKIQRVPQDGNKLLAPIEGYSGEEYSFIYWAPSIPTESQDKATFFYLSTDKTLFGRLDCKSEYSITSLSDVEKIIYVKLEYSWVVKTDGSRDFPK